MDANDIQISVCNIAKISCQSCLCCVKKYPTHSCIALLLFVLYVFFPLVFISLIYSAVLVGFAVLVHRVFISIDHPNDRSVGANGRKRWKQLQSRRSFRSVNHGRFPNQNNESSTSLTRNPPTVQQNAKEAKDEKDDVFSKIFNDDLVNKNIRVKKTPKEIRFTMPVKHGFDNRKGKKQENLGFCEDESDQNEARNKMDGSKKDDEKSLMDLGISQIERTKRLESLIARRRSRKLLSFPVRRNGTGQIPSLHIPKPSPLIVNGSGDPGSPVPGSAPSYLVPRSPFDIPYDPYEEKPNLTEDSFMEEFMGTHKKEPKICRHVSFSLGTFVAPESPHDKHKSSLDGDFVAKRLASSKIENSTLARKEDDDKQRKHDSPIPNKDVDNIHKQENLNSNDDVDNIHEQDNPISNADVDDTHKQVSLVSNADVDNTNIHATEERESSEKVVDFVDYELSTDQSSSSSSSSEDEPILRPNREAILHCLSMSRLRVASGSGERNFHRHHDSFDSDSALFDKTIKDDCFFYEENKRVVHHTPTSSIASDLQVEVSELTSPPWTDLSSNVSEIDVNEDFERPYQVPAPDSQTQVEGGCRSCDRSVPEEQSPVNSSLPESVLRPELFNDRGREVELSDQLAPESLHEPEMTSMTPVGDRTI